VSNMYVTTSNFITKIRQASPERLLTTVKKGEGKMGKTMKAMILEKPAPIESKPLKLVELPVPEPGYGEILVKVNMCGLCHTDLHTVEGDLELPVLPIIPGHQIVGTVVKRGDGVHGHEVGDRVGAAWLNSTCGTCAFCKRGLENMCVNARFTGYHVNGGYSEYTVLPADFVYRLPDDFSDRDAAPLLCAGIVGYRAFKLSGATRGDTIALYGFGASAHVVIQVAIYRNCRVIVFTRSREHMEHAMKLGAIWAGKPSDTPPEKPTSAIIFAPAGEIVLNALETIEKGGTVALAGITMTPIPEMDYEKYLYYEKILRSVTAATREDGRELMELAGQIPIRTDTTLFKLEDANEALQMIKESRISGAGVLKIG